MNITEEVIVKASDIAHEIGLKTLYSPNELEAYMHGVHTLTRLLVQNLKD